MYLFAQGHSVFRRLQYAVTAPVANFSLAGCIAALTHHSKQHPIHRWTGCPENVLHYSDVIYAMMIGMSKVMVPANTEVSMQLFYCTQLVLPIFITSFICQPIWGIFYTCI